MNPTLIVGTVNAALSLLDQLLPAVREAVSKGEITVDQQLAMEARIEQYRNGNFFGSPQWQVPSAGTDAEKDPPPL